MMLNVVYGHAYISGTKKDLLVFILRSIRTLDGSRVSAKLDDIAIVVSEQFNTQDMHIKGLDEAFVCFDDHEIVLFDTKDPDIYSIYCTFERRWYVNAKTISNICRKNNVSMEINLEDPGLYLLQHILVGHTGKILADDEIDYYSEDSLFQKPTGKCDHSSWFLMKMHRHRINVFWIENIGINFPNTVLDTKSDSSDEQFLENEETEPCEMCGALVIYGFSLCDSCADTVDYMRDDGIYILKNGKRVNTLKHVKGVHY